MAAFFNHFNYYLPKAATVPFHHTAQTINRWISLITALNKVYRSKLHSSSNHLNWNAVWPSDGVMAIGYECTAAYQLIEHAKIDGSGVPQCHTGGHQWISYSFRSIHEAGQTFSPRFFRKTIEKLLQRIKVQQIWRPRWSDLTTAVNIHRSICMKGN